MGRRSLLETCWFLIVSIIERFGKALGLRTARSRITSTNTPLRCPVNQPRGKPVRTRRLPYVWYYRSEVRNETKEPVQIIEFAGYSWQEGRWVNSGNILGRPLGPKEFALWYTEGAPCPDGWIAPGETAVCDPLWSQSKILKAGKQKWVFIAKDKMGNRYRCEAPVYLLPGNSTKRRSADDTPDSRVPITSYPPVLQGGAAIGMPSGVEG